MTILIVMLVSIVTKAQSSTDGATPLGLSPGLAAGSYSLSDFDTVSLYNGGLNFRLAVFQIGGRGGAGYPLTIHLQKRWTVFKQIEPGVGAFYFADGAWWSEDGSAEKIFAAGKVAIRSSHRDVGTTPVETLTRITFTAPDGTEYELRDQLTNGQPVSPVSGGFNRGTTFVTSDGTTATFISDSDIRDDATFGGGFYDDQPEGYMMLKDGTVFRVEDGRIRWMRDRNGNKITFSYDVARRVASITDSLNRQVTFSYPTQTTGFTQISYKGFGGASRTIKIGQTNLANALRSGYSMQSITQLFPELNGGGPVDSVVVNYIEMPDGRTYQLRYNPYSELARVVLPTGGAIEYEYGAGLSDGAASGVFTVSDPQTSKYIYRRLLERRIYTNGGTGSAYDSKITYSRPETLAGNLGYVITETRNPGGTLLGKSQHYFYGSPKASFSQKATQYSGWKDGREYKTELFDTNGSTVLKRVEHTFAQRATVSWWGGTSDTAPPNDPRTTETVTTLEPATANLVSKLTFGFDDTVPFNNQNNVKEYDFGSGAAGSLLRETRTTFVTSSSYTNTPVHLRGLPSQVSIHDGAGVERARLTYEYDSYANVANHALLTNRSDISGLDPAFDTNYATRGNVTATTKHFLVGGSVTGGISTFAQYDVAGNVIKAIDTRGFATNLFYADCFGAPDGDAQTSTNPTELGATTKTFAFVTELKNALNQSSFTQFDYYLGRAVDNKDANGTVASGYFNDVLDRPTEIRRAVGTAAENRSVFIYDDTNRLVRTTRDRDVNNDGILVSEQLYDLMGRSIETRLYEGATNYIAKQTQYDTLGRAFKNSNPFRSGETVAWTTLAFDALGRVVSVTTPDNAVATTAYAGNSVTVSDQIGNQSKRVTDALGRLLQVYEAPNDVNFNYLTSYSYDTLDNLSTVTQGTQTRTFTYDSLSRLQTATNPENGTVSYQYDGNGNLIVKTDARAEPLDASKKVSAHFEYDALNRMTRRWYNGSSSAASTTHNSPALPSGVGATDEVKFYYDSQTLPGGAPTYSRGSASGRLVAQTYGTGSTGDYYAYDVLGRPTLKIQQTGTVNYQMSAAYNLSGALTSMTYPSSHTIANTFDVARRLITFSGNLGDGTARTYSSEILYSSFGVLAKEKFGTTTPVFNKLFYNVRGQLAEVRASTSYTGPTDYDANRGAIVNSYSDQCVGLCLGVNMPDNNGNLKRQDIEIPGAQTRSQYYAYDSLNRLKSARELISGVEQWKQQFTHDRWGNRTIDTSVTYGIGINNTSFEKLDAANQLYAPGDLALPMAQRRMRYDDAGNLTNDTYTGAGNRTYDAENKITSAWGGNNQAQLYSYDASGQRIKRTIDGVQTWQVYGFGGELVAEYPASGAPASPQKEYGYRNGQLLVTLDSGSGLNGYANRRTITIDHTKVPNTDQSNFPVLISGTYSYLATLANGGNVQHANGHDVIFTSDSGCTTKLDHEVETYNPLTGGVTYWVRIPSLSHTTDTTLYLCYGNSAITTAQTNKTGVWNSNFKAVYHLGDQAANTSVLDSSANASNGVNAANTNLKSAGGKFGQALTYNGSNDNTATGVTQTNSFTWECWFKLTDWTTQSGSSNYSTLMAGVYGSGGALLMAWKDSGYLVQFASDNVGGVTTGAGSIAPGSWHHVAYTRTGNSGTYALYLDGEWKGQVASGTNSTTSTITLGTRADFVAQALNGLLDETRISNVARSGDWIKTQYNNQNSPGTFYTISGTAGTATASVNWLVADHLGSPRMVLDQTGSLANMKRHDYLPFGEELAAPTGGRNTAQGYAGGDGVRQHFTSKEREVETTLDYFGARYYSSVQGRFTGVDPEQEGVRNDDPQSWNGYAYTGGNPMVRIDPDGKKYLICNAEGKGCVEYSDEEFYRIRRETRGSYQYTGSGDFYESGAIIKDGEVIATYVQISIDDYDKQVIFAVRRAVSPIPKATLAFFGISVVAGGTGGAIVYALTPYLAPTITTLKLATEVGAAGAGAFPFLDQLSKTDARIFQRFAELGASAKDSFQTNLARLADAVFQIVPNGKIEPIGRIGNSLVYGGRVSGIGIAEVNGVQVVVKMVHGNAQIIGQLPK